MREPKWGDVDDAIEDMAEALENFTGSMNLIREYLSNLDTSNMKKKDAKAWDESYHLCDVVECANVSLMHISVELFNKLNTAKWNRPENENV